MYEQFFHFKELPFTIAPNPRYLYVSRQHREALAHLTYGLKEENGGFVLLVGEVGTGKTTVCRCMLEQIPEPTKLAMVLNPCLNEVELLETICDEFGIEYPRNATIKILIDALNAWLLRVHAAGQRAVVVIEEAQNLSVEVLEQLRLLTNLETNEHKLLQIVLIGQTELLTILERPELRQLSQRVVARYHLHALNQQDVQAYISHRLQIAGGGANLFSSAAVKQIAKLSKGLPRLINLLCDRALLGCYAQGKYKVDVATVKQASREVFGEETKRAIHSFSAKPAKRFGLWAMVSGVGVVLITAVIYLNSYDNALKSVMLSFTDNVNHLSTQGADNPPPELSALSPSEQEAQQTESAVSPLLQNTADIAPASRERLSWGSLKQGGWGETPAYRAIFRHWGLSMLPEQGYTPCEFAQNNALDCWHKRGSFSDIRRLNRPVVLKMFNQQGKMFYVALLSANNTIFQVGMDDQTLELPRSVIESSWSGEYTVLWKRPPGYVRTVRPGDYNVLVGWLAQQLGILSGRAVSNQSQSLVYDAGLITQVRRIQRLCKLQVDGLFGKETIIMFNTINSKVPVLFKDSAGTCPRRLNV